MRTISRDSVRILSMGVFLFCLMFPFISDAVADSQPATLLNTAQEARETGDREKAEGFYQQIIDNYPASREAIKACQELAIRRVQLHEIENAESLIETLKTEYSASPDTVDALYSVAQHYQWNGLPEEAINLHRYNSAAYPDSKKAMWSHGAIVHYYIEQKDFDSAQKEYNVMADRFKEQPTLPQEFHQFAEKYRTTDEPDRALELHRLNATHSPVSSMYTMWSQGAIIHHYIRHGDFTAAKRETDVMIGRFSEQPTLPEQLHQIAEEYRYIEEADRSFELHQYNATHSPVSSKYTMQSQGALVHYLIEHQEFYPAEVEYQDLLSRFKDQPTLPQEIYQFAVKYNGAGEKEKALELHRYNVAHFPATSLHAMQSQGAIVHHCIETKDFEAAQLEIDVMTSRFSEQETFPQELYQFALKYQGVGATEKALTLHQYNATHSPASSKYSLWSQGALIHHAIGQKDYEAAQKGCEAMISRFAEQETLSHELQLIADKYQGAGQYDLSRSLCQYGLVTFSDADSKLSFKEVLIKILLAESDDEQAALACSELLALCTNNSQTVKVLTNLGHIYRNEKQWAQALPYFQKALEKAELPKEELDAYTGLAMVSVWLGDDDRAQGIIDLLMKDYSEQDRLGYSVFIIGEEYYLQGDDALNKKEHESAKSLYFKALAIWENNIRQIADIHHRCLGYYDSANAFRKMGQYRKAIEYYHEVVTQWPEYDRAWNAQFMIAVCYDQLFNKDMISGEEAKKEIIATYQKLEDQYPNSKAHGAARMLLEKYEI